MNLTMNSTITELSCHACNFVLKVLDREGPGVIVGQKLILKLQPQIASFQKISVSRPAFLHNFRNFTIIYFSNPVIKIS